MSVVHIARTMQVALRIADEVAKCRGDLQEDRKETKKAERKRKADEAAAAAAAEESQEEEAQPPPQEPQPQKPQAKQPQAKEHAYILRCSPPFVAGKGS